MDRSLLLALAVVPAPGRAADPPADEGPLPRFEPLEPADALASSRTQGGFRMGLLAAGRMVLDPDAEAFENARRPIGAVGT